MYVGLYNARMLPTANINIPFGRDEVTLHIYFKYIKHCIIIKDIKRHGNRDIVAKVEGKQPKQVEAHD